MSETERKKTNRQWVRPGQRLRIEMEVEVLTVDAAGKVNLKVHGDPTATCVDAEPSRRNSACNPTAS